MNITNIISTKKNGKVILSGQLVLTSGKTHDIYFEVDSKFEHYLSKDATPFLPLALPIAMRESEDVEVSQASSKVISNASKIMRILQGWNTGFSTVSIHVKHLTKNVKEVNRVGCFFSGGVDSFYTFLKNRNKINHLIFVHGFDIPAKEAVLYKKVEKNIRTIAKTQHVKLFKVKTNLRETLEQYFGWDMAHVFALASVSCLLSNGFREICMSCGQTDVGASHHYMTPELDILWSTERMKINHFGCNADKIMKLKYLSTHELAMQNLRVCWVNKMGQYNCCECEKCFRNMLALHASDSLEKCKTFEKPIQIDKLKKIRVNQYVLKYFISLLNSLKRKNDISEIRYALEECINSNNHPRALQKIIGDTRAFIGKVDKKYNRNRLYWYLARRAYI